MTPREVLQSVAAETFQMEGGERGTLAFAPALSKTEVQALEKNFPAPLPAEIVDLLGFCSGFSLLGDEVAFARERTQWLEDIFPCGSLLFPDGFGNDFFVEVDPKSGEWGAVFYACHDAPALVLVQPGLAEFLVSYFECFRRFVEGGDHMIDFANGQAAHLYYKKPGLQKAPEAITSSDPIIADFARTLPEGAQVADLRAKTPGSGFPLGVDLNLSRCGRELVFGLWTPPRKSLWDRLFGS